jgi:tRNA (mo5U34)-methyltransferase
VDALALGDEGERFDLVICFGILHRVENPLGLLRRLAALLAPGGRMLVETYGIPSDGRLDARTIEVQQPGGVYAGDEHVYWGFGAGGLGAIGHVAGLTMTRSDASIVVDGHPRIIATLTKEA